MLCVVHAYECETSDATVHKIIFAKNRKKTKFVSDVRRGDKFLLNEFFIAPSQAKEKLFQELESGMCIRACNIHTGQFQQNIGARIFIVLRL